MSQMRWVITEDLIEDVVNNQQIGRGTVPLAQADTLQYEFKLLDDDRVHYYTGRCESADFDPLDWAASHAGCTIMQYRKANTHDQWEDL